MVKTSYLFREKLEHAFHAFILTMNQIPVRKIIWDAFELAIETQARRLAKDVAATLGQDPSPLLKSIRDDTMAVYLFDEAGDDTIDISEKRCPHLVALGAFLTPCWNPTVWTGHLDTKACLKHCLNPSTYKKDKRTALKRFEEYYINEENGDVYDQTGVNVGRYSKDGAIQIFELDD